MISLEESFKTSESAPLAPWVARSTQHFAEGNECQGHLGPVCPFEKDRTSYSVLRGLEAKNADLWCTSAKLKGSKSQAFR
jgi:hypothetical protein